ncbi:MAG: NAD-dependent epimerase/dehydratase family protein [Planctomycetes bacterium]|nr:NAD-dependent epimerase/dehydratase family protein [Planctomycetota bacterium]
MPTASTQRVALVTGGAGFIGSHLVEHLVLRGDHVVVVDDLTTGCRGNLEGANDSHLTFMEMSVSQALRSLGPSEIDEIYHLAAAVGVRLVIDRPIGTIETNVLQTSAVLNFAAEATIPILIASTSEVYGKSTQIPFAEDDDVVYGPPSQSRWAYACSKAIDEHLALAHYQQNDLPVVVVRFFNIVGPRQVGRYGMVLPRFVASALAGAPIEVYGDGRQTRCFCDVRDVVAILPKLLADPTCAGGLFNLGSDQPIEIRALAELVRDALGSRSPIVKVPYDRAYGQGFDDLRHRQPDLTRIRQATGFVAQTGLVQTIRDLAYELDHRSSSSLESTV